MAEWLAFGNLEIICKILLSNLIIMKAEIRLTRLNLEE